MSYWQNLSLFPSNVSTNWVFFVNIVGQYVQINFELEYVQLIYLQEALNFLCEELKN